MKKSINCISATLFLVLPIICSCESADDFDVLDLGYKSYSQNKLSEYALFDLIDDNRAVLDTSGLSLVGTKTLENYNLSLSTFFNDKYNIYPIYNRDMKKFHLVSMDFFKSDTVLIHFKYDYLQSYVDSLLKSKTSYIVKELTWNYESKRFKTIALFDRYSGELEYDNVLFNTFKTSIPNSVKRLLTRSEGGHASNVECISFTMGDVTASGTMSWSIDGEYITITIDSTDYRVLVPGSPEINDSWTIPSNFPDVYDVVHEGRVTVEIGPGPYYKPYYTVYMGIGYTGFIVSGPFLFDRIYWTTNQGNGYSYKRYIE